jgi:hypothetical protein
MMCRLILTVLFFSLHIIGAHAGDKYAGITFNAGVRILSFQSFNNALQAEGLAKLNPTAFDCGIGQTVGNDKFDFTSRFGVFVANGKENLNYSRFWGLSVSLDYGYKVWKNDKMCLYPYFGLSYIGSFLGTYEDVTANTFASAYAQPAVSRSFSNGNGELDAALGLSYQIKAGKGHLIRVNGGYQFPLLKSKKWYYLGNKVKFPKVDCRGWEIGITWVMLSRKYIKKEELSLNK